LRIPFFPLRQSPRSYNDASGYLSSFSSVFLITSNPLRASTPLLIFCSPHPSPLWNVTYFILLKVPQLVDSRNSVKHALSFFISPMTSLELDLPQRPAGKPELRTAWGFLRLIVLSCQHVLEYRPEKGGKFSPCAYAYLRGFDLPPPWVFFLSEDGPFFLRFSCLPGMPASF